MPYLSYVKADGEKASHSSPEECRTPTFEDASGKGRRKPGPGSVWACPTCRRQWKLGQSKEWILLDPKDYIVVKEHITRKRS